MELWIRSQNKVILQKTNALFIAHSDENIWSIIDNQNMTKYAEYTTRERALEVLDEIQNILSPQIIFQPITKNITLPSDDFIKTEIDSYSYEYKTFDSFVYQMPKD